MEILSAPLGYVLGGNYRQPAMNEMMNEQNRGFAMAQAAPIHHYWRSLAGLNALPHPIEELIRVKINAVGGREFSRQLGDKIEKLRASSKILA